MASLYDELDAKLNDDPRLTKRGGARYDLGLLLFDFREPLHELYGAAERHVAAAGASAPADLRAAVDRLRPLFGEWGAS